MVPGWLDSDIDLSKSSPVRFTYRQSFRSRSCHSHDRALYPLTLKQNIAIERIWRDARWLVGGIWASGSKGAATVAGLMTVGSTFPKYRPVGAKRSSVRLPARAGYHLHQVHR